MGRMGKLEGVLESSGIVFVEQLQAIELLSPQLRRELLWLMEAPNRTSSMHVRRALADRRVGIQSGWRLTSATFCRIYSELVAVT